MYVHLSWDEGGTGANEHGDGFKVYRKKPGDSSYSLLATITSISTTTYNDTDLSVSGTYYYQVYEYKDNTLDEAATVSVEVNLNTAPTAPTSLLCEGSSNPQAVADLTPEFSAIYNDPDSGDIANQAYIQVNTSSSFDGVSMWDSGWLTISNVTEGNRCANISYAGTALALDGSSYYWRIAFKDDSGAVGAWSAAASFTMRKDLTVSDTGVGQDTSPLITAQITMLESGIAVDDAPVIVVPIGVADAGTAQEELPNIAAALPIVDAGAGQDAVEPVEVRLVLADSGGASEAVLAWHPVSIADTGAALDAIAAILAQIGVVDSGIGTDDSGLLVLNQFTVVDAGVGTDTAPQVVVSIPLVDGGVGADAAPQVVVTLPLLTDIGVGQEAVAIRATFTLSDAATGQDALAFDIVVPLAEVGIGTDSIAAILAQVSVADTGAGQELLDFLVSFGLTDSGAAQDVLSLINAFVSVTDAGVGADTNPVIGNWIPQVAIDVQYPEEPDIEYSLD